MKKCGSCKLEKPLGEFGKDRSSKDGLKSQCKGCKNFWRRTYYKRNPKNERAGTKKWDKTNPEKRKEISRRHDAKPERQAYLKKYREDHQIERAAYQTELLAKNVSYRIASNLRQRLRLALKGQKKINHTLSLLGCPIKDFLAHLESKFVDGMSWDNYGKNGWHIDHIKACAQFDLAVPEQQQECFHYTNLQPLWATDNLKKNKYSYPV